jgi:hypothetical protein
VPRVGTYGLAAAEQQSPLCSSHFGSDNGEIAFLPKNELRVAPATLPASPVSCLVRDACIADALQGFTTQSSQRSAMRTTKFDLHRRRAFARPLGAPAHC